ncbi:WD40 repeat domain-containing protein [Nonomuraea guangzhouensis]|uniref:WD40 repeat domain-containing protein n=1 Tax=Nonomuraea guangzhouensis TaxID=1291555 RepID=A0ABW4GEW1_9ACTN|nr:WD40 repeat domain-containing protein [Nonomuraea guangzhouensis]
MTPFSVIRSAMIPSAGPIEDFDIVRLDGRSFLVCVDTANGVFLWDPSEDRWSKHRLDMPFHEDSGIDGIEVLAIGAVVHDGRIVVGGGADHQPFAQWDLESGAVRVFVDESQAGLGQSLGMELDGRPMLVGGDSSTSPRVRVWDVERRELHAELCEHHFDGLGALTSGMLKDRPVLVSGSWDGSAVVWDLRERRSLVEFGRYVGGLQGIGLVLVGGRPRVVAASRDDVVLGDPETGEWGEPLAWPDDIAELIEEDEFDDFITCMDAGLVDGRPVAVTGTGEGRLYVWDLEDGSVLGEPLAGHNGDVSAVRLTELDGRTAVITAGRDGRLLMWSLDSV